MDVHSVLQLISQTVCRVNFVIIDEIYWIKFFSTGSMVKASDISLFDSNFQIILKEISPKYKIILKRKCVRAGSTTSSLRDNNNNYAWSPLHSAYY